MDARLFQYMKERKENIERHSIKITAALNEIEKCIDNVTQGINFRYVDPYVLLETTNSDGYKIEYNLFIDKDGIYIRVNDYCRDDFEYIRFGTTTNKIQKCIVKRLPIFLNNYVKELAAFEDKCQQTANMAEQLEFTFKEKAFYKKYGSVYKPE